MNMHTPDILALLPKELDRLKVIERYQHKQISQVEAARLLGVSERHLRRLIRRIEVYGAYGICNQRKGKRPSNRICDELKQQSLGLIKTHFYDYGPTLAAEKLWEYFDIKASKETVRQWMIEDGLWQPNVQKAVRVHPPRARRAFFGELIQIDGSYHKWFEERGPKCCLLVFIDDATSRIMKLQFAQAETTIDYLAAFKDYVLTHGAPRAVYFDKHNVFHINQRTAKSHDGVTQFCRVLKALNTQPIYAHSPQAKGRVERANETLQDRLIKELRFHNINNIKEANQFLGGFVERYNQRFEKQAYHEQNMHRQLTHKEKNNVDFLFSIQTVKKISKDLLIRHNKELIKILPPHNKRHRYINQKAVLCENLNGKKIYFNGREMNYIVLEHYLDQDSWLNRYWSLTA
jgi:phage pi2 protein 07